MNEHILAFQMDVDTAIEFFNRVKELTIDNEQTRQELLLKIMKEKNFKNANVSLYKGNKVAYIEHLKKHYNILRIDKEEK